MPRLTLRTLLAYIDDVLDPDQTRSLGRKVAESDEAKQLIERIKKVTRRRGLRSPIPDGSDDDVSDPNTVAAFLSDNLDSEQLKQIESTCLESDVHLAEVAACHQILTLVLTEPVRVPPSANQRMYRLVESPAADHQRKPGKTIPVGRVTPPTADHPDADDPDAALLLGLSRYGSADSWAARLGLVGAAAAIVAFLALAVLMALPHAAPEPPESSRGVSYALAPTPTPTPTPAAGTTPTPVLPVAPEPKAVTPVAEPGPKAVIPPVIPPKGDPGAAPEEKVLDPLPGRAVVGKMETPNVIVVTRPERGANWTRIDPNNSGVVATDPVMALPGYKAKVELASGVVVHLWGNVPEQLAMEDMVMQSRVRFHPPAPGFDADLTLEEGRIYLATTRATGSKIRVRFATETWDVTVPNDKFEVLMQVHTAFVPGTPYAREGGGKPRIAARLVVTHGTAHFNAPSRHKQFGPIPTWSEIDWNSKTATLVPPTPARKEEVALLDRVGSETAIPGDRGQAVQGALSDAARNLNDTAGIRILLEERINSEEVPDKVLPTMLATYAYAAIAEGPDAPSLIANLYDLLKGSGRSYARQAAVVALSAWLPGAPGNTALFVSVLTDKKKVPEEDADRIAQLLRGYSSFATGDTSAIDKLVEYLDNDFIAVREAALGNLIAFFDPEAVRVPALLIDVSMRGTPAYKTFLEAWKARAEEIKKKMTMKK